MTAPAFARAVEETGGVCVVGIGVLEKYGDHLSLGTDLLAVQRLAAVKADTETPRLLEEFYRSSEEL